MAEGWKRCPECKELRREYDFMDGICVLCYEGNVIASGRDPINPIYDVRPLIKPGNGYAYVIGDGSGAFKIGSLRHPKRRLKDLQVANPRELRLRFRFMSDDYLNLERKLQLVFHERHIRNEWYWLTRNDVNYLGSLHNEL